LEGAKSFLSPPRFFPLDNLPEIPALYQETIADLEQYRQTNTFILK
jgi:hypothetical protein